MKVEFAGKYAWHGVYLDDEGEEHEFITFADDVLQAIKYAQETLLHDAVIVALEREEIPENKRSFEVDNPELEKQLKRKVN